MKKNIFLILCLVLAACSHQSKKENTKEVDAYWENLNVLSQNKEQNLSLVLAKENPNLLNQINLDTSDSVLTSFWGQSFNFDSGAKKIILNEKLIEELQAKFKIKNDNHIVHAGIMHTYGYLFSVLETPYGFKRKRWTDPTLSFGFNFNDLSISPNPKEGTLLSNITFFAGKLAFTEKKNIEKLNSLKNVSSEVKNFSYGSISRDVLDEQINYPKEFHYSLRTTLVKFQAKMANEENDYLLIYSYLDRSNGDEKLITAFPIRKDAYSKTLESQGLGEDRPILVRYNGYLGGDKDLRLSGKRLIFKR